MGSSGTLPQNRACGFYRTRLALYVFPKMLFIRECSAMELLMTFLAKDQGVPLSCGHHTLPQFLSFRYIFQLPNVMNFKAAFRCLTIFTLLPVEPLDDLRSAKRPERGIWLHVQVWIVWHRFSQVFESKHSDGAGLVLTLYGEYLTIIR